MKIAVTGHRPPKIGGYDPTSPLRQKVRETLRSRLEVVIGSHIWRTVPDDTPVGHGDFVDFCHTSVTCITGMALGVDQDFAKIALDLGCTVHAYIPGSHGMQCSRWPQQSKDVYYSLLERCHRIEEIIGRNTYAATLQKRNEAMVDAADHLIAVWDGSSGGTKNCLDYALKRWIPGMQIPFTSTAIGDCDRITRIDPTSL